MVAMGIRRVAPISGCPSAMGEEFMLRLNGPVGMAGGVPQMQTLNFLQKGDVGIELVQPLAQFVDHHAAIELREAFVNIVSADAQSLHAW